MAKSNMWLLAAIGVGAYYLWGSKSGPSFTDAAGNPITSIRVGQIEGFDVPGYQQVWLTEVMNGSTVTFDGPYRLPMQPYAARSVDIGTYNVSAYALTDTGNKGALIGTATLTVSA